MMLIHVLWDKVLKEAKKNTESDLAQFVFGLERALAEHKEEPLEIALRNLIFAGPTLRVSVEDLGKLIHDLSNLRMIRQEHEHKIEELTSRVALLTTDTNVVAVSCPRCDAKISVRPTALEPKETP